MATHTLTTFLDTLVGTTGADVFVAPPNNANLAEGDVLLGGAGHDVVRFDRTDALSVSALRMGGLSGIDELDVRASSSVLLEITDTLLSQSDARRLTIRFDADPLALDLRGTTALGGTLVLAGTGQVRLYDALWQRVTIADGIAGDVLGGAGRDLLAGGSAADVLDGAAGDDLLTGAGGADRLLGGAGFDRLEGGAGNDILSGGADHDVLAGGIGVNTSTGGIGSDTFVVGMQESLIITDFTITDPWERIDLRATGVTAFGSLAIAGTTVLGGPGAQITAGSGTVIRLAGVDPAQLTAAHFVFAGDPVVTIAAGLSAAADFAFTDGIDNFTGGSGNEIFEISGNFAKLSGSDRFDGGAGTDVLRILGDSRSLSADRLAGMRNVEVIDMTGATGPRVVEVTRTMTDLAGGTLSIRHGAGPLALITDTVGDAARVIVEGTGRVTLRDTPGQGVRISDSIAGDVTGQDKGDTIIGGALGDTIGGAGGDDSLSGGGGDDIIDAGAGADTVAGGAGRNLVTLGAGGDRVILTPGEDLTITDFEGAAGFERIDITATGVRSLAGMKIAADPTTGGSLLEFADGSRILLAGYAPGRIAAGDFIFAGQTAGERFVLTDGADSFRGGDGADVVELLGTMSQLDGLRDRIDGGGGIDTLRVTGADRDLGATRLSVFSRTEIIDLTDATGSHRVTVTAALLDSSDSGTVLVRHGAGTLLLDTGAAGSLGRIVTEGTGAVTLRDAPGQMVAVSDAVAGDIRGAGRDDLIAGGRLGDRLSGMDGNDSLAGGGGNDILSGDNGDDILSGGAGNDSIDGGAGRDIILADGGADRIAGGSGSDLFVIGAGAQGSVITGFETTNFMERIDLSAFSAITGMANLSLSQVGADTRITGAGVDLRLAGVQVGAVAADDFLFAGQAANVFDVRAGTSTAQIQRLIDEAPEGAVIRLGEGVFEITQTLLIGRSDITLSGAGEGRTILRNAIPDAAAAPVVLVHPEDLQIRFGPIAADAPAGSRTVTLAPGHGLVEGDLLYVAQANDDAWLKETGNTGWIDPGDEPGARAEDFFLREFRAKIIAVDGDTVTLEQTLPYSFAAGIATAAKSTFLSDVHLSDFTVEGRWGKPDPYLFEDTLPSWNSVAAVEFDGARDSSIANVTVIDPAAHAFRFQRTYEVKADTLTAQGAHDKGGASGYHFILQEAFDTHLANLTSHDARHAVLFSSYSAEHDNTVHVAFTNRDINFHGSPDTRNTVIVDVMRQDYLPGSEMQWTAVHPGVFPLHPYTDISANDVTFRNAVTSDRSDTITAHDSGGTLVTGLGNDRIFGGAGNDVIDAGENGDTITLGGGRDLFIREFPDLSDVIIDFAPGALGDTMLIRGSAYESFKDLRLTQVGADVVLDFGPGGTTTFRNTRLADLTEANFRFQNDTKPGQFIGMRATEMWGVGTDRGDVFGIGRTHLDSATFGVLGGTGADTVAIAAGFFNGELGARGSYRGIDAFDLSTIPSVRAIVNAGIVAQSDAGRLTLFLGDSGDPVQLDVGPLARGHVLVADGARAIQLTGGRDHALTLGDRIGGAVTGDSGRDVITGGRMADRILGGAGNDALFGGVGNDTLDGGTGADSLTGGLGSDVFVVDSLLDRVVETASWAGIDHVISGVDFRMGTSHIETLQLTGAAVLGVGNGLMNTITGNAGNNTLDGGKNNDVLIGGLGNDVYLIRAPGDRAVERAGEGTDTVLGFRSVVLDDHVENLFIQTLRSSAGLPIQGVNGFGNALANTIVGNPFDNTLSGREGNDILRGQAGADTFLFDRAASATNTDRILDFDGAEDRLLFTTGAFGGLVRGALAPGAFELGTAAADANDRFIYHQPTGRLWYDSDGTGAAGAQLVATLSNLAALAADDIFVI